LNDIRRLLGKSGCRKRGISCIRGGKREKNARRFEPLAFFVAAVSWRGMADVVRGTWGRLRGVERECSEGDKEEVEEGDVDGAKAR
jgi:hypothetical protein